MAESLSSCDPNTPAILCVTMGEIAAAIPLVSIAVLILGVGFIIHHERLKHRGYQKRPGTEPGQGASIIQSAYGSGEDSHGTAYIHTKDPQIHAKAFVPEKARQK